MRRLGIEGKTATGHGFRATATDKRHILPPRPSAFHSSGTSNFGTGLTDMQACSSGSFLPARWFSPYPLAMSTHSKHRAFATLAVAVCLSTFLVWAGSPAPPARKGKLHIDFLDVGRGDSALITSPTGKTVLIDGGLEEVGSGIVSFLRSKNACPLDMILLTHRHADHLGGLVSVIEACGTRLYLDAPYPHQSSIYARLVSILENRHVSVRQAERGRTIDLGDGARLLLLGPPSPDIAGADSDVNANSVVSRLDYGNGSVLFAADAEELAENWLLGSGANLRATVLKVGHHGSRHSSTLKFLEAVMPLAAVISTGSGDAKHPHADTVERLARVGAKIFRTDQDGTIAVDMDGALLTVRGRAHVEAWKTP
jgi:beta-lactamase superfamily II metal-dependent hydrolase